MTTTNPFTYLRNKSGMTMRQFCDFYKFAKQTLIGMEAGLYPELSERMLETAKDLGKRFDIRIDDELMDAYGTADLQTAYAWWIDSERGKVVPSIRTYNPDQWTDKLSPMHFFVKNTTGSAQGFAKQLKIPPATLMRYVTGKQAEMPSSIERALRAVDYPYMAQLITNQRNWTTTYE